MRRVLWCVVRPFTQCSYCLVGVGTAAGRPGAAGGQVMCELAAGHPRTSAPTGPASACACFFFFLPMVSGAAGAPGMWLGAVCGRKGRREWRISSEHRKLTLFSASARPLRPSPGCAPHTTRGRESSTYTPGHAARAPGRSSHPSHRQHRPCAPPPPWPPPCWPARPTRWPPCCRARPRPRTLRPRLTSGLPFGAPHARCTPTKTQTRTLPPRSPW